jgi:cation:H+ antiporter
VENEPRQASRTLVFLLYVVFVLATVAGIFIAVTQSGPGSQWPVAGASFAAVITASLLLSWAAEAGEFIVSQGFIVATIALVQVLPEFMIEAVFAWRRDTPNMLANLTGSNRLLMGFGWPMIYVTCWVSHYAKTRKSHGPIHLEPAHAIEVWSLIISSGYFVVILLRGSFVIIDGVVLLGLFVVYYVLLLFMPAEEEGKEDLLAPSLILVELPRKVCIAVVSAILVLGSATMILIASPFVNSMKVIAEAFRIREFYFVQWVAPFLTEFPEKVTAFYWAKRVSTAPMALLNMVSSKVNQWTLLASMIPFVYAASLRWHGMEIEPVPIDAKLAPELWLSLAMTMYGAACLLKRQFTGANCLILFVLWFVQFVSPDDEHGFMHSILDMRRLTIYIFAGLTPVELILGFKQMTPLADLKEIGRLLRGNKSPS